MKLFSVVGITIVVLALALGVLGGGAIAARSYNTELSSTQAELDRSNAALAQIEAETDLADSRFARAKRLVDELNDVLKPTDAEHVKDAEVRRQSRGIMRLIAHEF